MSPQLKSKLRIAGYIAVSLLSAGTLLAAYGGMVNPEKTVIPALLTLTFPGWILAEFSAIIICLIFCRRMAVLPAVTLAICMGPLLDFCPVNLGTPSLTRSQQENRFTLLSYNVMGFGNNANPWTDETRPASNSEYEALMDSGYVNQSMEYILHMAPDIGCFHECPDLKKNIYTSISQEMEDSITRIFPHQAAMKGERIATRYSMQEVTLRQPDSDTGRYVAAEVNIDGHKTLLVAVHLESICLNSDDKQLFMRLTEGEGTRNVKAVKEQLLGKLARAFRKRAVQARELREQIDSLGYENVIIAGDFNDIAGSYALRTIAGDDFRSVFTSVGCGPVYTYHSSRLLFNIDHVLYKGDMKAVGYRRDKKGWSDHYPVAVEFCWETPAKQ